MMRTRWLFSGLLAGVILVASGLGYLGGRLQGRAQCAVTLEQAAQAGVSLKTYMDEIRRSRKGTTDAK
jgi:hypothetical protein